MNHHVVQFWNKIPHHYLCLHRFDVDTRDQWREKYPYSTIWKHCKPLGGGSMEVEKVGSKPPAGTKSPPPIVAAGADGGRGRGLILECESSEGCCESPCCSVSEYNSLPLRMSTPLQGGQTFSMEGKISLLNNMGALQPPFDLFLMAYS